MKHILITGATGGLGQGLVDDLLHHGYRVRATGRNAIIGQRLKEKGVEFIQADLLDTKALDVLCHDIDIVIHAAALSSPWGRYKAFYDINVVATQALLQAAKTAKCTQFIFISSPSIYASDRDQLNLTEDKALPKKFLNAYAKTKYLAEKAVIAAHSDAMICLALRPRAIICKDDQVLIPRILRFVTKGFFPYLRDGQALIEPTHILDVALAVRLSIKNSAFAGAQVFNISSGKAYTIKALVSELANVLRKRILFIPLAFLPMRIIVNILETLCKLLPNQPESPITDYSLCAVSFSQTFDLTKAKQILGYVPEHDALEAAKQLAHTLQAKPR